MSKGTQHVIAVYLYHVKYTNSTSIQLELHVWHEKKENDWSWWVSHVCKYQVNINPKNMLKYLQHLISWHVQTCLKYQGNMQKICRITFSSWSEIWDTICILYWIPCTYEEVQHANKYSQLINQLHPKTLPSLEVSISFTYNSTINKGFHQLHLQLHHQ